MDFKAILRKITPLRASTFEKQYKAQMKRIDELEEKIDYLTKQAISLNKKTQRASRQQIDAAKKIANDSTLSLTENTRAAEERLLAAIAELVRASSASSNDSIIEHIDSQTAQFKQDVIRKADLVRRFYEEWKSNDSGYIHEYRTLPEERPAELRRWYKARTGNDLDLENPITYNEKIQWYKLQIADKPMYSQLADKIKVRDWVASKIGSAYLSKIYGPWHSFDEISFDALPNRFVLKANHSSGMVYVVEDKSDVEVAKLSKVTNDWLRVNFAYKNGYEMHYASIEPLLFAEEYLVNEENDLFDYKFWCFDGKVEYIMFLSNRAHGLRMSFFDTDWNLQPFRYIHDAHDEPVERPDNLEEMISLAEKLSEGFQHVRVDFYDVKGRIIFGEMTFTSASGTQKWIPASADYDIGQLWTIRPVE